MIVLRRVTHVSPYRGMDSGSMENINSFGKLLAINKFADIILSEFDPELLEFKDFSAYQEESIKNGTGYSVHPEQYMAAPTGNQGWALAPLFYGDNAYERNSLLMPKTTKLLKWIGYTKYAGITSLNPNCGLDWHTDDDPLRCFYTLRTDGLSYIEVQGEGKHFFKERDYILFKPRKKHRVWNDGAEPRYSLVIDVW